MPFGYLGSHKRLRVKKSSEYEGFKHLDQLLFDIAEGKKKAPRAPQRDFLCGQCSRRKRTQCVVPCSIWGMGRVLYGTPFEKSGQRMVVCCQECADRLRREGAVDDSAQMRARMKAAGLVVP